MLGAQAELICRSCRSVIVQRGSIIQWKDLPSEGWAEMMDFWHCHKPDDHGQEGHYHASIGTKGYAAAGRLVAKPGVGFVDVLSFLLAETDCTEVKQLPHGDEDDAPALKCAQCASTVGIPDAQTEGWRLYKPSLVLSPTLDAGVIEYDPSIWLSCYVLSAIDSQGVRKFAASFSNFELWIFAQDLTYSATHQKEPTRAMKVLFRHTETPRDVDTLSTQNLSIGTLALPSFLELQLLKILAQRVESGLVTQDMKGLGGLGTAETRGSSRPSNGASVEGTVGTISVGSDGKTIWLADAPAHSLMI
ncbi:hypothetical protein M8818_002719 [Zalaria obscura]|uniref:Uncharacterized protein n=1 Tax=Zalaria obscura TaxID=2024903 RepID=A0ACC3SGQ0_9PEZI